MTFLINNRTLREIINLSYLILSNRLIAFPKIPQDNKILFFKRDRTNFEFLSNFYPVKIKILGVTYPDVEHYYQYQKSVDPTYRSLIIQEKSPSKVKHLGDSKIGDKYVSSQSYFKEHPDALRKDWNEIKISVMKEALYAKFIQNKKLLQMLIMTKDADLIEDSPNDLFWGIGSNGKGENNLGLLLMKLRNQLRFNKAD